MLIPDRPCEIRYLRSDTAGLSRGRNIAIDAASHDHLVFTHDDMFVAPGWARTLARELLEADSGTILTGQVRPEPGLRGGFQLSLKVAEARQIYEGRIDEDVLYAGNMALRRSAIEQVGGFDERMGAGTAFPGAEDNDMGWRLLEAGYRIVYIPEAVVYHREWRTGREYLTLWWDYGVSQRHSTRSTYVSVIGACWGIWFETFATARSVCPGERVMIRAWGLAQG